MLQKLFVAALAQPLLSLAYSWPRTLQQTEEKPKPTITGSVDAYYRYNFQNAKDPGVD